jgi:uncharacterized protein (TIGR02147 family)
VKTVFEYIDYRQFLSDYYTYQKKQQANFSYRFFSMKAGTSSPSLYRQVVEGERNLSPKIVEKYSRALKFGKKEALYFSNLVKFNQAKTSIEKQQYYNTIIAMNVTFKESALSSNQFEYFSNWYIPVIRELVCIKDFKENYSLLAQSLIPPILSTQVKEAIEILLKLKMIKKTKNGAYEQRDQALIADPSVVSLGLQNFMESMLENAKIALRSSADNIRNISSMTLGISFNDYESIVEEIKAFKNRVKSISNNNVRSCDRVYQFNLELFPVSKVISRLKEDAQA